MGVVRRAAVGVALRCNTFIHFSMCFSLYKQARMDSPLSLNVRKTYNQISESIYNTCTQTTQSRAAPHLIECEPRRPGAGQLRARQPHDRLGLLVPDHLVPGREEGAADVGHLCVGGVGCVGGVYFWVCWWGIELRIGGPPCGVGWGRVVWCMWGYYT